MQFHISHAYYMHGQTRPCVVALMICESVDT